MRRCAKRRALFAEEQSRRAKRQGRQLAQSLSFLFRKRYNLPPTDPRFLEMTPEGIEADYWAHHYAENPTEDEVVDEEYSLADEIAAADAAADMPDDFEDV